MQQSTKRSASDVESMAGMKRFAICTGVLLSFALQPLFGQGWTKTDKTDAFSGNSYVQYRLTGKFLTPPRDGGVTSPTLILQCSPHEKKYNGKWYFDGQFIKAFINVGAVLNHSAGQIPVMYRRDDGKAQSEQWGISTDGTALFISEMEADEAFYGHFLPHKVGTSPPVTKLVLMADEYLGTGIVMQFDLTGVDEVGSACGLAIHQK